MPLNKQGRRLRLRSGEGRPHRRDLRVALILTTRTWRSRFFRWTSEGCAGQVARGQVDRGQTAVAAKAIGRTGGGCEGGGEPSCRDGRDEEARVLELDAGAGAHDEAREHGWGGGEGVVGLSRRGCEKGRSGPGPPNRNQTPTCIQGYVPSRMRCRVLPRSLASK